MTGGSCNMANQDVNVSGKKKKKHPVLKAILIILIVAVAVGYFAVKKAFDDFTEETNNAQAGIIGTDAPDFTVTTTDGSEFNLSEALKEKDAVVLNVFATWCGPCEREFPEIEEVYQKYQDKIGIVAVSNDSMDVAEDIVKYKKDHGLSFPMAYDDKDAISFVPVSGVPTTIVIDRNSKIMFLQSGSFANSEAFEAVITPFMDENYDGKPVYLYTLAPRADEEYVPGVTFKATSDDGSEIEATSGDDGFAYFVAREPHTYTIEVTGVPDGYKMPSSKGTVGPLSEWVSLNLSK